MRRKSKTKDQHIQDFVQRKADLEQQTTKIGKANDDMRMQLKIASKFMLNSIDDMIAYMENPNLETSTQFYKSIRHCSEQMVSLVNNAETVVRGYGNG